MVNEGKRGKREIRKMRMSKREERENKMEKMTTIVTKRGNESLAPLPLRGGHHKVLKTGAQASV